MEDSLQNAAELKRQADEMERHIVDAARAHVAAHKRAGYAKVLYESGQRQHLECGNVAGLATDLMVLSSAMLEVNSTWVRLVEACGELEAGEGDGEGF
jgi:hypothetical protein